MHATVTYRLPALFSLRMLQANALTARTLVCPTPAALKMALLAILLRRDGPAAAQEHLDWLAPLGVAWSPPARMAVTAATVRAWKGDKETESLVESVGMREYAHTAQAIGLAILDVPDGRRDDVAYGLSRLRALGNAESLVQPLGPPEWTEELDPSFVPLTTEEGQGDYICLLDDLGSAPSFDRVSVYRATGRANVPRLGEDRRRLLARLPLRVTRRTADSYHIERLP
jgi:hypothetical protein